MECVRNITFSLFVIYDMQERKIQMVNSMASNRTNKKRERERNIEKATKKARNNKKEKQISKDQFNAFY